MDIASQKPATHREEDVLKSQQHTERARGLTQNPARQRNELLKSQQEREMTYSKASKRERLSYSKSSKREK